MEDSIKEISRAFRGFSRLLRDQAEVYFGNYTPLERSLREALSAEHWSPPNSQLYQLARQTTGSPLDYEIVMRYVIRAISEDAESWRCVYKGLCLFEAVLKLGNVQRAIPEAKKSMGHRLNALTVFSVVEEGRERAAGIREKAKVILSFMSDPKKLAAARKQTLETIDRVTGASSSYVFTDCSYDSGWGDKTGYDDTIGGGGGYDDVTWGSESVASRQRTTKGRVIVQNPTSHTISDNNNNRRRNNSTKGQDDDDNDDDAWNFDQPTQQPPPRAEENRIQSSSLLDMDEQSSSNNECQSRPQGRITSSSTGTSAGMDGDLLLNAFIEYSAENPPSTENFRKVSSNGSTAELAAMMGNHCENKPDGGRTVVTDDDEEETWISAAPAAHSFQKPNQVESLIDL